MNLLVRFPFIAVVLISGCWVHPMVPVFDYFHKNKTLSHYTSASLSAVSKRLQSAADKTVVDGAGLTDDLICFVEEAMSSSSVHSYQSLADMLKKGRSAGFDFWLSALKACSALDIHDQELDRLVNTELFFSSLLNPHALYDLDEHDRARVFAILSMPEYQKSGAMHSGEFGLQSFCQQLVIPTQEYRSDYNDQPVIECADDAVIIWHARRPSILETIGLRMRAMYHLLTQTRSTVSFDRSDRSRPPRARITTSERVRTAQLHHSGEQLALVYQDHIDLYRTMQSCDVIRFNIEHPCDWLYWITNDLLLLQGGGYCTLWNSAHNRCASYRCPDDYPRCKTIGNRVVYVHKNMLHIIDLESLQLSTLAIDEVDHAAIHAHHDNRLISVGTSLVDLEKAELIFELDNSGSSDLTNHILPSRHFGFTHDGTAIVYVTKAKHKPYRVIRYALDTFQETQLMELHEYPAWAFSNFGLFALFDTDGMHVYDITADGMRLVARPDHCNYNLHNVRAEFDDHAPILYESDAHHRNCRMFDFTDAQAVERQWKQMSFEQKWLVYTLTRGYGSYQSRLPCMNHTVVTTILSMPAVIRKGAIGLFFGRSVSRWAVLKAAQLYKGSL